MDAVSVGDWAQIISNSALVAVTGVSVLLAWHLATLAKGANLVATRVLETSHRVQLDARLPLYVLSCEYFQWSPPEQGEVEDGEYIMTWRIELLSSQPARLSIFPPANVTCAIAFDGRLVTRPIHLATKLGGSHTISWRAQTGTTAPDPGGLQALLHLDDFIESVVDTIRLTATWETAALAELGPVVDINRMYPRFLAK
jgi:hypothetical protein